MKRASLLCGEVVVVLALIFLFGEWVQATGAEGNLPTPPTTLTDIRVSSRWEQPMVDSTLQFVYGPDSCTEEGDPVSPNAGLNPWWSEQEGVYTYRIDVPASYPHDIVRVELFDPDSINAPTHTATITHSRRWVEVGRALTETLSCPNGAQQDACALVTCELEGQCDMPASSLDLGFSNPVWLMRVDENREAGCVRPNTYNPSANTTTQFELFHYRENAGKTLLSSYTGQIGDGTQDNGNHQTDLQWVSPGGFTLADQPAIVPADCSSLTGGDYDPVSCPSGTNAGIGTGFEIQLSQYLTDTILNADGSRSLYLEVTALAGSSRNGFNVWAGPAYTTTLSSHVNERNLQLVNDYGTYHTSENVTIFTVGQEPQHSILSRTVDIPVAYIPAEYAGKEITVSMFDPDDGTKPPIEFYLDTIPVPLLPPEIFGEGIDDMGRCFDEGTAYNNECNNQWISPTYSLKIPIQDYEAFYEGNLIARYQTGSGDNINWKVTFPDPPLAQVPCTPYPIGIYSENYSIYPSDYTGGPLHHPNDPVTLYSPGPLEPGGLPSYTTTDTDGFYRNKPGYSLAEAQPGYIYQVNRASSNDLLSFVWLTWDGQLSIVSLGNSLVYPGNLAFHTNPPPGYVRYINPFVGPPFSDLIPNSGDWIQGGPTSVNSSDIRLTLSDYINRERVINLPIYDMVTGAGSNFNYRLVRYGFFRLHGFKMSGPLSDRRLLLEFIGWGDDCYHEFTPPALTVADNNGMDADLEWTDNPILACDYEVHQSNDPYFALGNSTHVTTTITGTVNLRPTVIGDPNIQHYFAIRANSCTSEISGTVSNEVGEFDYAIIAGD